MYMYMYVFRHTQLTIVIHVHVYAPFLICYHRHFYHLYIVPISVLLIVKTLLRMSNLDPLYVRDSSKHISVYICVYLCV